ncbi:MAG TPA: competence/damage-inducible protein A [bacterium]|nr:competence/damage-inducible protein A [bacterium]HOG44790.1 competence/damage-inducible protein A [bacterium]HPY15898.1 competence/damage-inducible protein A [bacterium]HQB09422.1 competence/damage-inducible protein A [bacterium]HQM85075.1 competence/damage-inducible protein A [bacterium]
MKNISVSIVSIGTEILLGEITNTNSQFLAVELANLGINVFEMVTIGDNRERLLEYFDHALKKYDMIIATGGLGPTVDDISKETACEFFGLTPVINEEQLEYIRKIFARYGRPMTDNNIKQAMFPENAVILKNRAGSAPGCMLEKEGKKIILLPGPPNEMKQMFEREVKPILSQLTDSIMYSEVVKVCGIGESAMEEMVRDIIDEQVNPTVAPYAKTGECRLRVTAKAENIEIAKALVAPVVKKLVERLGDNVYTVGNDTLAEVVVKKLIEKKLIITGAESCTGGLITSALVDCPGVSAVLHESFVTYSNDSKIWLLGVGSETLKNFGAVSIECAREMAEGLSKRSSADVTFAVTGIAGPDGGSEEKPVGTICFALCHNGTTITELRRFNGDRTNIRIRASIFMLDMIRRAVYLK